MKTGDTPIARDALVNLFIAIRSVMLATREFPGLTAADVEDCTWLEFDVFIVLIVIQPREYGFV